MTSGATTWPKSERRRESNGSERRSVENDLPVYWVFQFLPLVGADITLITLKSHDGRLSGSSLADLKRLAVDLP